MTVPVVIKAATFIVTRAFRVIHKCNDVWENFSEFTRVNIGKLRPSHKYQPTQHGVHSVVIYSPSKTEFLQHDVTKEFRKMWATTGFRPNTTIDLRQLETTATEQEGGFVVIKYKVAEDLYGKYLTTRGNTITYPIQNTEDKPHKNPRNAMLVVAGGDPVDFKADAIEYFGARGKNSLSDSNQIVHCCIIEIMLRRKITFGDDAVSFGIQCGNSFELTDTFFPLRYALPQTTPK